jgi:hypothetical protein
MLFNRVTLIAVTVVILGIGFIAYLQPNGSLQQFDLSEGIVGKESNVSHLGHNTLPNDPISGPKGALKKGEDIVGNDEAEFQFIFTSSAPELWPLEAPMRQVEIKRRNQIKAWVIDINRDLIENLIVGEQFNIYIPQTERRLTMTLKSVKRGRYSESRIASIDSSGQSYATNFTLGKSTLYGAIETPEGIFHVEKRNGDEAVIYAGSEVTKNLDYSISDVVPAPNLENVIQ